MFKKNVSIIAPNIKNGGGKELLLYLLEYIDSMRYNNITFCVYVDKSFHYQSSSSNIKFIESNSVFGKILLFTKKIDNALYFGNLPPMFKSKRSILYFHSPYLLYNTKELFNTEARLVDKIKELCKQFYISLFIKNINNIACQTPDIKRKIECKYNILDVKVLPFYRMCRKIILKKEYDFCYISLAHPHKNHYNLFKALEKLSNEKFMCSIAVTVENNRYELIHLIDNINKKGFVKIVNYGVVSKEKVCEIYQKCNCLIFPSLSETFGLPLLEASSLNIDIICSDLKYAHEVIQPSLLFNPNSFESIADSIKQYLDNDNIKTILKIENKINELLNLLIKE